MVDYCTESDDRRPHALMLPFPAQGHINPMLNLATQLAVRGVAITFVNTEEAQKMIDKNQQRQIQDHDIYHSFRLVTIPGGYLGPPKQRKPGRDDYEAFIILLRNLASQQELLEQMVMRSRDHPQPITCIISDSFFPWTVALSSRLGIQRAMLWTTSGVFLDLALKASNENIPTARPDDQEIQAGGVKFKLSDIMKSMALLDPEVKKMMGDRFKGLDKTMGIIVNTFEELEAPNFKVSHCGAPVHYVGPVMQPAGLNLSANFIKEESECLNWLDKQDERSVLYISFGSIASLTLEQIEELAAGLVQSKQPFLWVERDRFDTFPEGFLERTCNCGIVVKWAPQMQVLAHPAVGGFFTHCGWNSVIESIYMGVPMLCFPFYADQHINAFMITKVWKLGISANKAMDPLITRDEIQMSVTELMQSEDLHNKAALMKAHSRRALETCGSSSLSIEKIIHNLMPLPA